MAIYKKVDICKSVPNRLLSKEIDDVTLGLLLGYQSESTVHILNVCRSNVRDNEELMINIAEVEQLSPAGISVQGIFIELEQAKFPAIFKQAFNRIVKRSKGLDAICGDAPLLVCAFNRADSTDQSLSAYFVNIQTDECTLAQVTMCDVNGEELMVFQVKANLTINVEMSSDKNKLQRSLLSEITRLQNMLKSPGLSIFHIPESEVFISNNQSLIEKTLFPGAICGDLLQYVEGSDENEGKSDKISKRNDIQVVKLELLTQMTGDSAKNQSTASTPIIHQQHKSYTNLNIPLPVNILAQFPPDMAVIDLPAVLIFHVCLQLDAMLNCLLPFTKVDQFSAPVPHHFLPPMCGHYFTVIYPKAIDDDDLETYRKDLHDRLLCSKTRPLFRRVNAISFNNDRSGSQFLTNTHVGLPKSGVKHGKVSLVQGTYTYHHYMQNNFDDNGWGCAYRSLQTLVSWFRHQAYTDCPIPTHQEIQQALVAVGDKPQSFVGSQKWIGSTEVSYVLDHLLGVTCKILFVSTGEEMGSMGRQLEVHFQNQGTPIMIGGGVLAHTIIGVDFSEVTGETKFLILDPHYTGGEDIKVIQNKGWCAWKGLSFWKKNAYYNMCCPQIPKAI